MTIEIRELLKSGAHFGHQKQKWNPKMAPYIFAERNGIHIIDLQKTVVLADQVRKFIKEIALNGESIFLVGTKRQAQDVVREEADKADLPYVNYRWLGGMLTNFTTISRSIKKLKKLESTLSGEKQGNYTKKEMIEFEKSKIKLEKNLSGIVKMNKVPGAMIVVDPVREHLAVKEANKLGIPVIAIIDTNGDPDVIDFPIPANDDGMRTISLILSDLVDGYVEGHDIYKQKLMTEQKERKERPVRGETRQVGGRKIKVKRIATSENEESTEEKSGE